MNPIPTRLCPLLGSALLGCLILGAGSDALKAQSPVNTDTAPMGQWIPLPYFRDGTWWLPVNPDNPLKIEAKHISLAGNRCYVVHQNDEVLVSETGQMIIRADSIVPIDGEKFYFLPDERHCGIIRDDGRVIATPKEIPLGGAYMFGQHGKLDNVAKTVAPVVQQMSATALSSDGWGVVSNSQVEVMPLALDYCEKLGLLAVVQNGGDGGGRPELRVWDVRSRCCVWQEYLPGESAIPVSVSVLPDGRLFVSGGHGKYDHTNYMRVYDLARRQLLHEFAIVGAGNRPGLLRVSPLPDGRHVLSIGHLVDSRSTDEQTNSGMKGVRLVEVASNKSQVFASQLVVSAVTALPDGAGAIVGTEHGEVFKLNLTDGGLVRLGTFEGGFVSAMAASAVTALAVTDDGLQWAAGCEDGQVMTASFLTGSSQPRIISGLDGEVTALDILADESHRIAIRTAGSGGGFYQSYWVTLGDTEGLIWNPSTNTRAPLPAGGGVCVIDQQVIALGMADGSGVALWDTTSGREIGTLGVRVPPNFVRGVSLDRPSSFRTNADGSQLFINGSLFDFQLMKFVPARSAREMQEPVLDAARIRMIRPAPVKNDDWREVRALAGEQAGWGAVPPEGLKFFDFLLLGPKRQLTPVLLKDDFTSYTCSGLSPSGNVAAIYSAWKHNGTLRLVDLPQMRVMSPPNHQGLPSMVVHLDDLDWVKPLDDDGRRVMNVAGDRTVAQMLDYPSGRTISRLFFGGEAAAVCCSIPDRKLYIATTDSAIKCLTWDDAGVLSIVGRIDLGGDETWTATLANGLFMSNGAERLMSLASPHGALPLDTGAAAFHRPHEVARALGAKESQVANLARAYDRRCKRDGLAATAGTAVDLKSLPTVTIKNRLNCPLCWNQREMRLEIQAHGTGASLKRIHVDVNGVPLQGGAGELAQGLRDWSGEIVIPLTPGSNKIQFSVIDNEGFESLRETVVVWHVAGPASVKDLYVLAIGVSDYRDDGLDLGAAAKDANDLVGLLAARQGKECREVKTLLLTNQDAVRERILKAREFLRGSKEQDQVVIFVAGHGFVDQGGLRYWFGTHDIDVQEVDHRGVSYEELEGLFDGVPARQRLLLMDTCFAGEVDAEAPAMLALARGVKSRAPAIATVIRKPPDGSFDLMREMFSDLRKNTGATVITASSGMEFVFAEERAEGDNGVFTYCLLDALRTGKADGDGDGSIRISELQAYLLTKVPAMTGGRQRPTGRQVNPEADFVIGTTAPQPPFDAKKFVTEYLGVTTRNGDEGKMAALFSPEVQYFGKRQTPGQIVMDEESYHQKFPKRFFGLYAASLKMALVDADHRRLSYNMSYNNTSKAGESKSGSQDIEMEVVLHEGVWKVSGLRVLKSMPNAPTLPSPAISNPAVPAPVQVSPMQGAIVQFLNASSTNGQESQFAGMFADSVDYFGKRFTRTQIYNDEISSHRNWPYRRLSLVGPVEQINISASEVLLRYTMSTWQSKTPNGGDTSKHLMEMRLRQINGKWFITSLKVRKQ